ncbi:hypothetical protein [Metabacillus malikii]
MKVIKLCFLLMLTVLLCVGCVSSNQQEENVKKELSSKKEAQKSEDKPKTNKKTLAIPLEVNEEQFSTVLDWMDEETLFYTTNSPVGTKIHTYNIFTGESTLFYELDAPLVQFEANVNQSLFFIHTSPSPDVAEILIIDDDAKLQYKANIKTNELEYTWNQVNGEQLFISSFDENWSFSTSILNVDTKQMIDNPFEIPFIQWARDSDITYLKWDQDIPALTAPLYSYDINKKTESLISNDVVANTNFINVMSTIELIDNHGTAYVKFYRYDDHKLLSEMKTRLVSLFSEWSVPSHDMHNDLYVTVEVDENLSTYSLISFNYKTKKKETIYSNLENLPIKISPDGQYVLYGASLEYIIDIKNKQMQDIIKLA